MSGRKGKKTGKYFGIREKLEVTYKSILKIRRFIPGLRVSIFLRSP
jgi:hypothetical protein